MNRKKLLEKFKERAKKTEKMRRDPRYRKTLGLLIQLGFLNANEKFPRLGNQRLALKDAIWAGQKVEPRILEVLPAAFTRLPKRFSFTTKECGLLERVAASLRENKEEGPDFMGAPYKKLKIWYEHPLQDHRTKTPREKKVSRTFRLRPEVIERLEKRAKLEKIQTTTLLEQIIMSTSPQ